MDTSKGKIQSQAYNNEPVIKGKVKVWFINGDLVKVYHSSRSTGIVTFYNITKDRLETCLLSDFKKIVNVHTVYQKLLNLSIGIENIFQV